MTLPDQPLTHLFWCTFVILISAISTSVARPSRATNPTVTISKEGVWLNDLALTHKSTTPEEVSQVIISARTIQGPSGYWRGPGTHSLHIWNSTGVWADFDTDSNALLQFGLSFRSSSQAPSNAPSEPYQGIIRIGETALRSGDKRTMFFEAARSAGLYISEERSEENFQITAKDWNVILMFRHNKRLYEIYFYPKA